MGEGSDTDMPAGGTEPLPTATVIKQEDDTEALRNENLALKAQMRRMSAALDTLSEVLATVKKTTVHGQSALQQVLPATVLRSRSRSRGGAEKSGTRALEAAALEAGALEAGALEAGALESRPPRRTRRRRRTTTRRRTRRRRRNRRRRRRKRRRRRRRKRRRRSRRRRRRR